MKVRVCGRRSEALDVISLDLRPVGGAISLKPYSAGTQIDVRLSSEEPSAPILPVQYA